MSNTPHLNPPPDLPVYVPNEGETANPNSDAAGWCMDGDGTVASPCYPLTGPDMYPIPLSDNDYVFDGDGHLVVCPNPDGPG